MNETKPPLALAPPLTGNQLVEAERAEQLAGAWRALATLFPTETARWLATQCDPSISIDSARVVQMVPSGKSPVHAADAEPEQPELIPVDVVGPVDGLSVRGEPAGAERLELTTPGGFTLRFPADIAPRQLGAVLGVIEGASPC